MNCVCGSGKAFGSCCEPVLKGEVVASTAEQMMRARYTAYVRGELKFIRDTLAPEKRKGFNLKEAEEWSKGSEWLGLEIMTTERGQANDKNGVVEFTAKYRKDGEVIEHHEVSKFRKDPDGQWYFVDGDAHTHKEGEGHHHHHHAPREPMVREGDKVGRNDPCPCGSGKKYKKCCAA